MKFAVTVTNRFGVGRLFVVDAHSAHAAELDATHLFRAELPLAFVGVKASATAI